MDESYETFEEELWPPRADPPPQKPVRQTRRPVPSAPVLKAVPVQNKTQIETPWENVTLNRCLFVAITILVLTSGFQRLHETLRGQGMAEEEEVGLTVRRSGTLRHRGLPPEPETSLWDVMFWWLPDLDDDDDDEDDEEDDDGEVKRGKRGVKARASSRLRNKPLLDKKLLKQRKGKLKDRRGKKARDEETKEKKERDKMEEPEEAGDEDEDEGTEEAVPEKNKKPEEKENKKTHKG
ncbi:junctional sarcoplasmic reticulum protein 1 isoform X2 [Epinephelus moara]|uniref:junctional sarcoplasmic reticulum protein 1 isoform X2 n=1 Tax=Epinephelus moara TaxID=300413 RepID=UPI00214EE37B|nr:junctional sarcoplasmic reticulum protein 1 isoform X2 [Epinephelus moara]